MSMISLEITYPSNLKRTIEDGGLGNTSRFSPGIYLLLGWQHTYDQQLVMPSICKSVAFPILSRASSAPTFCLCLVEFLAARRQVFCSSKQDSLVLIHVIIA